MATGVEQGEPALYVDQAEARGLAGVGCVPGVRVAAVDELKEKVISIGMQMEADPAFIQRFADPVFDAVLHEGEEEERGNILIGDISGEAEADIETVAETSFFQFDIITDAFDLSAQGDHGSIAFVEDITKQGRKLKDGFGRFFRALHSHGIEAVQGIEKEMGVKLRAKELELDGELFFFETVLVFLLDEPFFYEADGYGDPADAEQRIDGAGKIIWRP